MTRALLDGDQDAEALHGQVWYTRPARPRRLDDKTDDWEKLPLALPILYLEEIAC